MRRRHAAGQSGVQCGGTLSLSLSLSLSLAPALALTLTKAIFEHWTRLHLERCAIGPAGCRMLARVLRLPGCRVHSVNLARQQIGADGTAALVR